MTDIFNIKWPLLWLIYSFNYLFIFLFLLFWIVFYFILNYIFNLQKIPISTSKKIEKSYLHNEFRFKLNNLLQNFNSYSSEKFYKEVSYIIKFYLYTKWFSKNIFSMTYKEIENKIDDKIINVLKKTYYNEFNKNIEDDLNKRQNIIEEIKKNINFN